ncbi:hypothetical protein EYV94_14090 [Puteibacter caeruleilacunae]|nr:hypothetical protein EYV94_14090 [Puteibacter caeruleilacunae]
MAISQPTAKNRIVYLDVLRVLACFMVVMVHAGDAYLWNADQLTFGKECSFLVALLRPCVPLFIIMSSILLLPVKTDTTTFLKRRFTRVLIPFLVWSIIYVFLPTPNKILFGGPENAFTDSGMNVYLYNLIMVPMNFTGSNVHFWFIYTILGLYLFMPILSPWIQKASKKALQGFLGIWIITLLIHYVRIWFPQIHGECDWNEYGMLYYFGGYIGYIVLGYYLHHYNTLSAKKSIFIGALLFIVGFIITYTGFINDENRFLAQLAAENTENWKVLEFSIHNLSPNVVMMTAGLFMFFQKIKFPAFTTKVFTELSIFSYGIFLVHYIVNLWCSFKLPAMMNLNPGVEQVILTLIIFFLSYGIIKLIALLPKSKYIIG